MKVTLDRREKDGKRFIWTHAEACSTDDPVVITEWVRMLEIARDWLEEVKAE